MFGLRKVIIQEKSKFFDFDVVAEFINIFYEMKIFTVIIYDCYIIPHNILSLAVKLSPF